jgi:hypothetical protein
MAHHAVVVLAARASAREGNELIAVLVYRENWDERDREDGSDPRSRPAVWN